MKTKQDVELKKYTKFKNSIKYFDLSNYNMLKIDERLAIKFLAKPELSISKTNNFLKGMVNSKDNEFNLKDLFNFGETDKFDYNNKIRKFMFFLYSTIKRITYNSPVRAILKLYYEFTYSILHMFNQEKDLFIDLFKKNNVSKFKLNININTDLLYDFKISFNNLIEFS